MEVLLNILWFALCNLAAWYWLQRWRRGSQPQGLAVQLSALACMLVLLFPVISATDDLYAAQLPFETSVTQKSSKGSSSGRSLSPHADRHCPSAVFTRTFSLAAAVRIGVITENDALPVYPNSISQPPQDRAPPAIPFFL
jgi:hypothetical protein